MWYFYKMGCGGFTKAMKFASRWKADRVALWGCLYFFAAFPVAALLPAWAGWENGPLEIAQDIILFAGAMDCLVRFRKADRRDHRGLWLGGSAYFLLLLGRELSWGRVFLQKAMTSSGPVFVSMHDLPHSEIVYGMIAVAVLLTGWSLAVYMPWSSLFEKMPVPALSLLLMIAAAVFASLGDKGFLLGGDFDEILEEEMELLVYLLNIHWVHWYDREWECADG